MMVLLVVLWPEAGPAEVFVPRSGLFDWLMIAGSRVEVILGEMVVL